YKGSIRNPLIGLWIRSSVSEAKD
ncbi:unnamed protein product, partial [Allacma fusca]